jgi:alditol oxidase
VDERNWAGNYRYAAASIERPRSLEQLQSLVASSRRIRALGSRHSFNGIADTEGVLVSLDGLPLELTVDEGAGQATVSAALRYGELALALEERGFALHNLASLPHISIAGALATGTHGSGDAQGPLSAAVAAVELVGPDGEVRRVARGDRDFGGSVVSLGAVGIAVRITLDLQPSFDLRQTVYTGLPWGTVLADFDAVMGSGYSVSLFTNWTGDQVAQTWVKGEESPPDLFGAPRATRRLHIAPGGDSSAVTDQGGESGRWLHRLPHFRMGFTPSSGAELQSEYLVPRRQAGEAIGAMRSLGDRIAAAVIVAEVRTIAADDQWLSGSFGEDTVGLHFTWRPDEKGVYAVLPAMEAALLPLGARPHWGKCFAATRTELAPLYPHWQDFRLLRDRWDPYDTFGNAFLDRAFGPRFPK